VVALKKGVIGNGPVCVGIWCGWKGACVNPRGRKVALEKGVCAWKKGAAALSNGVCAWEKGVAASENGVCLGEGRRGVNPMLPRSG